MLRVSPFHFNFTPAALIPYFDESHRFAEFEAYVGMQAYISQTEMRFTPNLNGSVVLFYFGFKSRFRKNSKVDKFIKCFSTKPLYYSNSNKNINYNRILIWLD